MHHRKTCSSNLTLCFLILLILSQAKLVQINIKCIDLKFGYYTQISNFYDLNVKKFPKNSYASHTSFKSTTVTIYISKKIFKL